MLQLSGLYCTYLVTTTLATLGGDQDHAGALDYPNGPSTALVSRVMMEESF